MHSTARFFRVTGHREAHFFFLAQPQSNQETKTKKKKSLIEVDVIAIY